MGETSELILEGVLCALCGVYMHGNLADNGYPVACDVCWTEDCGYGKEN